MVSNLFLLQAPVQLAGSRLCAECLCAQLLHQRTCTFYAPSFPLPMQREEPCWVWTWVLFKGFHFLNIYMSAGAPSAAYSKTQSWIMGSFEFIKYGDQSFLLDNYLLHRWRRENKNFHRDAGNVIFLLWDVFGLVLGSALSVEGVFLNALTLTKRHCFNFSIKFKWKPPIAIAKLLRNRPHQVKPVRQPVKQPVRWMAISQCVPTSQRSISNDWGHVPQSLLVNVNWITSECKLN